MDDLISRQAVLKIIDGWYENNRDIENIEDLIILITYMASIKPQAQEPFSDAISRADAIRVASGYCHWSNIPKELAKLPSVNPKPCGDVISRQAALEALSTWDKFGCDADGKLVPYKDHYIPYIHYDDVVKCIKGLPSVSTEKTGRWEKLSVGYGCSECSLCTNKHGIDFYRYCPNCGAKMEVENG